MAEIAGKPQLSKNIEGIQVLRALGLSAVVIGHALLMFYLAYRIPPNHYFFGVLILGGRAVLDWFFVISGFIMVYISWGSFGKSGAFAYYTYMRLSRILPIYWFYTTLAIIAGYLLHGKLGFQYPDFEKILKSYLFIPYESPLSNLTFDIEKRAYPILPIGWTLNYEMFFYLLFGLSLFFKVKPALIGLTVGIIGISLLHPFIPAEYMAAKFWTSALMWKFLMGVWLGYAFCKGVRYEARPVLVYAAMGLAWFFGIMSYFIFTGPDTMWFHALTGVLATIVVAGVTMTTLAERTYSRFVVGIGDASYSGYLIHFFAAVFVAVIFRIFFDLNIFVYVAGIGVTLLISLGIASVSYRKIELPALKFLRKFYIRKRV